MASQDGGGWGGEDRSPLVVAQPSRGGSNRGRIGSVVLILLAFVFVLLAAGAGGMTLYYQSELDRLSDKERPNIAQAASIATYRDELSEGLNRMRQDPLLIPDDPALEDCPEPPTPAAGTTATTRRRNAPPPPPCDPTTTTLKVPAPPGLQTTINRLRTDYDALDAALQAPPPPDPARPRVRVPDPDNPRPRPQRPPQPEDG